MKALLRPAKWLTVLALTSLLACQSSVSQLPPCLAIPPLAVSSDTFRLRHALPPPNERYHLPFSQAKQLLTGAYAVGAWLEDSTYTRNYYYAKSRRLAASSRGTCHAIIRSAADDFEGLFLILTPPGKPPFSVYLAGYLGSSGSSKGMFYEAPVTEGYILSDSVVVTKKGVSAYAFRASRLHSYTDTITTIFHLDYRAGRAVIQKRDSVRTPLAGTFD